MLHQSNTLQILTQNMINQSSFSSDMMALPVELADESGDVMAAANQSADTDESLTETTYANFLSLVRALFPARAAHRASKAQLRARCRAVLRSPIAPLNTWYSCEYCLSLKVAYGRYTGSLSISINPFDACFPITEPYIYGESRCSEVYVLL